MCAITKCMWFYSQFWFERMSHVGAAKEWGGVTGVWAAVRYLISLDSQESDLIKRNARYIIFFCTQSNDLKSCIDEKKIKCSHQNAVWQSMQEFVKPPVFFRSLTFSALQIPWWKIVNGQCDLFNGWELRYWVFLLFGTLKPEKNKEQISEKSRSKFWLVVQAIKYQSLQSMRSMGNDMWISYLTNSDCMRPVNFPNSRSYMSQVDFEHRSRSRLGHVHTN